jgi:hypothetical protein
MCENTQQQGDACDVCGMRLSSSAPIAVPVVRMPELEQTIFSDVPVAATLMPELDTGRAAEVAVAASEAMPDFESTRIALAADVPLPAMADMERTRIVDDGARTVLTDTVACRYCGHVQRRSGRFCEKCANALPSLLRPEVAVVAGPKVRCPSCGAEGEARKQCPECGYALKMPGE